jgi:hypothetical protein
VKCGRSRETAKPSDLAGWAEYGYCASHSRYFCGLRLHLVTTLAGLPVAFALAGAEADERAVPLAIFTADPDLTTTRPGQALPGGKNYHGTATSSPAPAPQPSWSPRPAGPPLGYHAPAQPARNGPSPATSGGRWPPSRPEMTARAWPRLVSAGPVTCRDIASTPIAHRRLPRWH